MQFRDHTGRQIVRVASLHGGDIVLLNIIVCVLACLWWLYMPGAHRDAHRVDRWQHVGRASIHSWSRGYWGGMWFFSSHPCLSCWPFSDKLKQGRWRGISSTFVYASGARSVKVVRAWKHAFADVWIAMCVCLQCFLILLCCNFMYACKYHAWLRHALCQILRQHRGS